MKLSYFFHQFCLGSFLFFFFVGFIIIFLNISWFICTLENIHTYICKEARRRWQMSLTLFTSLRLSPF